MRVQNWHIAVLVGVLLAAFGLQWTYSLKERPRKMPDARLAERIERKLEGWLVAEEPLGATEAATESALNLLNLDDFVYLRYKRGGVSFTIYVAYWVAGKMPTRLVAIHTPDRCWTENGMQCIDRRFKHKYLLSGRALLPAEWRVFVPKQELGIHGAGAGLTSDVNIASFAPRVYVIYWHLVAGKLYDYGNRFNAIPDPWRWWKDTLEQAAYGSQEQLFVRIASETPIEQLLSDPGFQAVLDSVAKLGLYAPETR
jgi:hypothetical protein